VVDDVVGVGIVLDGAPLSEPHSDVTHGIA